MPFPAMGRMLCHGTLAGVAVDGPGDDEDRRPSAQEISLAAGQTDAEAIAALLTTDAPAVAAADAAKEEVALTASGYDRARLFGDPEAITRLEELFHEAGFERISSAPAEDDLVTRHSVADPEAPADVLRRPAPVWFQPRDPVVAFRGAGRSLRHGEDGRFDPDGHLLACRIHDQVVTGLTGVVDGAALVPGNTLEPPLEGKGSTVLKGRLLPASVALLVREAALLDPYGIEAVVAAAVRAGAVDPAAIIAREQTLAAADLGLDADLSTLHTASIRNGTLPSPVGWNVWRQAWVPIYVEWELAFALDPHLDAWHLDELDLDREPTPMDPGVTRRGRHRGRSLFTAGPAARLASQAGLLLDESGAPALPEEIRARLETVAGDGRYADLSATGLDGLVPWLLGLSGGVLATESGAAVPPDRVSPPWLGRAGAARLTRLRLVDAFGRFLDLDERLPELRVSQPLRPTGSLVDAVAHLPAPPGPQTPTIALAPRLSRPARVRLQVCGPDWEPLHPGTTLPDRPPVAGWLLPDLADRAIEVFTPDGAAVGQVCRDPVTGSTLWEPPPGEVRDVGAGIPGGLDAGLAEFLRTLVAADGRPGRDLPGAAELSAVDVLLRLLDVTAWTSEPRYDTGPADVAGLSGAPTAVLRVRLTLEVTPDRREAGATGTPEIEELTAAAEAALAAHPFEVRLGALTRAEDGVRGFLPRSRPGEFTLVHPAVLDAAGLVPAPSEEQDGDAEDDAAVAPVLPVSISTRPLALRPGDPVDVLVFCDLAGAITVTTGILPRTAVQLPPEWTAGTPRLLSSFRFGPLLVDPTTVRMPAPAGDDFVSRWVRRPTLTTWADDPVLAPPNPGDLPIRRARVEEGWIAIRPAPKG
jgi:hypothetical protein